jgi:hypothetical protein
MICPRTGGGTRTNIKKFLCTARAKNNYDNFLAAPAHAAKHCEPRRGELIKKSSNFLVELDI